MLRIHLFGQNPYESISGLESEYICFFAIEEEYHFPWRDLDLSPDFHVRGDSYASDYNLNHCHIKKRGESCVLGAPRHLTLS